jgi:Flp pilus assembly protein TadG
MPRRQLAVTITTFALIAPVLMFIIFGTSESARIMYAWLVVTNEAAEAARYGAVHYDRTVDPVVQTNAIKTHINQRLDGVLAPETRNPAPRVVIDSTPSVSVTIYSEVELVIPIIRDVLPNPFPVAARSVMAAESGS